MSQRPELSPLAREALTHELRSLIDEKKRQYRCDDLRALGMVMAELQQAVDRERSIRHG